MHAPHKHMYLLFKLTRRKAGESDDAIISNFNISLLSEKNHVSRCTKWLKKSYPILKKSDPTLKKSWPWPNIFPFPGLFGIRYTVTGFSVG